MIPMGPHRTTSTMLQARFMGIGKVHEPLQLAHPCKSSVAVDPLSSSLLEEGMTTAHVSVFDLDKILEAQSLTQEERETFDKLGFVVLGDDSRYTDLEYEITYTYAETLSDIGRRSLNLHLSFDWEHRSVHQRVGVNLGSGFICELSLRAEGPEDFARQILEEWDRTSATTSEDFQRAFRIPEVRSDLIGAAQSLSRIFRRPPN